MMDAIETILARGPPAPEGMRATIAALYRALPVHGDPVDAGEALVLLRFLYRIARVDLPLARLFEGHVDARQIVARYGDPALVGDVDDARMFGVWNAALPGEPLEVRDGLLIGGKSYASGAGILTHALAGADTPGGNRLVLIDLARSDPVIDREWWNVVGMQRSHTHVVRWAGAPPSTFTFVGAVGDYAREPFFSGGALRFVACHAGGVAALFDRVKAHLVATDRAADPHQAGRLADLYLAAETAAAWVRSTAGYWGDDSFIARVAAARIAVSAQADAALTIAQQAVGVPGMFHTHPLSAALTDLMVYLRQPAPDAQRMRVGAAAAADVLVPGL